jgi:hypothetical protein
MVLEVVETFGPFLIPAALFAVGVVVYALLVLLGHRGLLPGHTDGNTDDAGRND